MNRRRIYALAAAAFLAIVVIGVTTKDGNGPKRKTSSTNLQLMAKKPCQIRNPPAAGEAIACHFGITKPQPTLVGGTTHGQCVDVAQWQGWYPDFHGLACVIIQANFGLNVEPSVFEQIRDANEHHVPYGLYTFMEPGVSGAAEARLAYSIGKNRGMKLGIWGDAEVNGTYNHVCEYTAQAHAFGLKIYGLYTAPGLWPGGVCSGYLWVAEWGISTPYPFGGYGRSSIILHQYCGTCFRGSTMTDLDRDWGITHLIVKPKPRRTLKQAKAYRAELRNLLAKHHCRQPPWHAALPTNYEHSCHIWLKEGASVNREIHSKGGR